MKWGISGGVEKSTPGFFEMQEVCFFARKMVAIQGIIFLKN